MRTEPNEIAMRAIGRRIFRRRPMAGRAELKNRRAEPVALPDALDEAFALLPTDETRNHRVDGPAMAIETRREGPRPNSQLLNSLAAQVAAIDRQCEQLAELIHLLESDSSAD